MREADAKQRPNRRAGNCEDRHGRANSSGPKHCRLEAGFGVGGRHEQIRPDMV
jgi:hypothetical protein